MATAFRQVVHGWPAKAGAGPLDGFAEVTADGDAWKVAIARPEPRRHVFDPVNAICELIVELNWSRLRQQPGLICFHAGAVEIAGRLVVFPSGRRAGKSTLTAELTRRGHRPFSDDILAVSPAADGTVMGLGTGVAPRLRLPVPDTAPEASARWVDNDPGPFNRQYKYLTGAPVPREGTPAPIGAIVTLDRDDAHDAPALTPLRPENILPILIHQNFGRFVHSGRALSVFEAIARDLPCLRLSYREFSEAADVVERLGRDGTLGATAAVEPDNRDHADLSNRPRRAFDPALRYRRTTGFTAAEISGEAYVADTSGVGIFRLNGGMLPIWTLLEEPIGAAEVVDILQQVFPDTGRDALTRDVHDALSQLRTAGLIEPA